MPNPASDFAADDMVVDASSFDAAMKDMKTMKARAERAEALVHRMNCEIETAAIIVETIKNEAIHLIADAAAGSPVADLQRKIEEMASSDRLGLLGLHAAMKDQVEASASAGLRTSELESIYAALGVKRFGA